MYNCAEGHSRWTIVCCKKPCPFPGLLASGVSAAEVLMRYFSFSDARCIEVAGRILQSLPRADQSGLTAELALRPLCCLLELWSQCGSSALLCAQRRTSRATAQTQQQCCCRQQRVNDSVKVDNTASKRQVLRRLSAVVARNCALLKLAARCDTLARVEAAR